MASNATLTAQPRSERGKNAARALRRTGRVPAALYGHNIAAESLSVDAHELERLLASISMENTLIQLSVGGGGARRVLIRELQTHPYRPDVLHVDFYEVTAGEKLHLEIPIRLIGNPVGVREEGGVLHEDLRDLHVACLPRDIPEVVEVDVSELRVGESVHVRDLQVPNAEILNDGDVAVCSIVLPRAAIEADTTPEAPAGVGDVEPELLRARGEDVDDVPAVDQG